MKICGIIAEYNPFHNGHKYHIEKTKELYGATHIVAVMSGSFTQRGDTAIYDKYERTRAALMGGVDLVIELPVPFALGSAEQFAQGAVYLLEKLGCVDILSFGSECADISLLTETAGAVLYAQEHEDFFRYLSYGDSYPVALKKTIEKYYENDVIDTLTEPNNTLAVEYIKALGEFGSQIEPVTVKRFGAGHDSKIPVGSIASASHIREMLRAGEDVSAFVPDASQLGTDMSDIGRLETAILSKLRTMSASELEKAPNVLMGLENRIYRSARAATSLAGLHALIKTKRFTMARIRRIVLCEFLGIHKQDVRNMPSYVHILGMNSRGREILSAANCELPVDTSLKALMEKGRREHRLGMLEAQAGDMYALSFERKRICGLDYSSKPVII